MIFVPDIFEEIIDSIRESGSYNVVNVNGNQYTINTPNTFNQYDWVNVNDTDYKIVSVTSLDFTIESAVAIAGAGDYKALAPYYLYGHRLDIANRLLEKDEDDVFKYQKYPLIALRLPITQQKGNENTQDVSLNVAIMEFTDQNYPSEKRYENVIKPILAPIYEDLLSAIENSSYFSLVGSPVHKRVDRLFWGIEQSEGNVKYIFNDPLDAIELIDLELNIVDTNC